MSGTYVELKSELAGANVDEGRVDDVSLDQFDKNEGERFTRGYGTFPNNTPHDPLPEVRGEGRVKFKLHLKYFFSGNNWELGILVILLSVTSQFVSSGSDYWLKIW